MPCDICNRWIKGEDTPSTLHPACDCKNALIMATCLVVPSGETMWIRTDKGRDYLMKVIEAWKEQHPEYDDTKCTMGCVEIMMPLEKYNAIQTTNGFSWPAA